MQRRPTLGEIHKRRPFLIMALAYNAQTSAHVVREMLDYQPVSAKQADAVLTELSKLHQTTYTRETVDVPILRESEEAL